MVVRESEGDYTYYCKHLSDAEIESFERLSKCMQNEAWLDEINRIVSFHEISDSRYYSAEEHDFWQMIVSLILAGYRVQ